jgi:tRNA-splicing ligase RtcB
MSDTTSPAPVFSWLCETLEPSVVRAIERVRSAEDVRHVAVMPDVHLASDICVGMAIGTSQLLYPGAVGGDIGCGMLAMAFDVEADAVRRGSVAGTILAELYRKIPAARRHRQRTLPMPATLAQTNLSDPSLDAIARTDGALQLGTLGGGNHFIELQQDENGQLWIMIHSGSRAMGQAIRAHHVSRARTTTMPGLVAFDANTFEGVAYLHDVEWARQYAAENRRAMGAVVAAVLKRRVGAKSIESMTLHCDHNHVQRESHFGQELLVHRKGCMPAAPGLPGVLPGSMGTLSYHVEGRGCPQSLMSSAHGAGRRFSRAAARERFSPAELKHQMRNVWFDPAKTQALREEAPAAYKDVRSVLRAQEELVRVTRTLRPILVYKTA